MAITIRARQGTQIGYKGTSGGSSGWINQAGASGRAALNMSSSITSAALQIQKAFDDDMDQSEIRQQVQDMDSGLSKMSQKWNEARYDPTYLSNNEKGFWQKREETQWGAAWEELTAGKDDKAVSEFGVIFNDKFNAAYESAGVFGRKQRFARLSANDQTNHSAFLETIKTSPSVQQKQEAFDGINNMFTEALSGSVVHRDVAKWTKLNDDAKADLAFFSAYENALGGLGLEVNPNNMETGYTAAHYDQAIININNDESIGEPDRKKLRQFFKDNLGLRIKAEKRQNNINLESLEKSLSKKFIAGELTIQDVEAVSGGLPSGRDMYWFNQLKEKGVYHWTPLFQDIKRKIQDGTVAKINDVTKDPHEVERLVRAAAKNMPVEEVDKLIKAIVDKSKNSELSLSMNTATDHARRVFSGPLSGMEKYMTAEGKLNVFKNKMAAADDKVTAFDQQLETMLKEGEKAGKTWMSMLDFNSPDYIVDTLINSINGTMPDEKPDDPSYMTPTQKFDDDRTTFWEDVKDWYGGDDAKADVVLDEKGNVIESGKNQMIIELYGRNSHFPEGTTYEYAKALTDANYADAWHGNAAKRIQFPTDHPGYNQYPNGTETPTAWRARLKLLGLN